MYKSFILVRTLLIEIGNYVQIKDETKIFNDGFSWIFREQNPNFHIFGKVEFRNDVYIGNNSMLIPGLIIDNDKTIGTGGVATKLVLEGKFVAGPHETFRNSSQFSEKMKNYNAGIKK